MTIELDHQTLLEALKEAIKREPAFPKYLWNDDKFLVPQVEEVIEAIEENIYEFLAGGMAEAILLTIEEEN